MSSKLTPAMNRESAPKEMDEATERKGKLSDTLLSSFPKNENMERGKDRGLRTTAEDDYVDSDSYSDGSGDMETENNENIDEPPISGIHNGNRDGKPSSSKASEHSIADNVNTSSKPENEKKLEQQGGQSKSQFYSFQLIQLSVLLPTFLFILPKDHPLYFYYSQKVNLFLCKINLQIAELPKQRQTEVPGHDHSGGGDGDHSTITSVHSEAGVPQQSIDTDTPLKRNSSSAAQQSYFTTIMNRVDYLLSPFRDDFQAVLNGSYSSGYNNINQLKANHLAMIWACLEELMTTIS
jgi:hypothetical protein